MTLIKTISGIRGTIGGKAGDNLTPQDVVVGTAALAVWMKERNVPLKVVVGRDGRLSGPIVSTIAINTLLAMGIDVVDLGLSTTPTVEVMVPETRSGAGIIFTASHNPGQWNALKFLNEKGEFISAADGQRIIDIISLGSIRYQTVEKLGSYAAREDGYDIHISKILAYRHLNLQAVKAAGFRVVVDCINSTGAHADQDSWMPSAWSTSLSMILTLGILPTILSRFPAIFGNFQRRSCLQGHILVSPGTPMSTGWLL